jgi:hypothetical protein
VAGAGCVGVDPPCYDEEAIVSVPADQPLNKNKEEALTRRLGKTLGWRSWNFFFFFFFFRSQEFLSQRGPIPSFGGLLIR